MHATWAPKEVAHTSSLTMLEPPPRMSDYHRTILLVEDDAAIRSLGISDREREVLDLLASGAANKVIARRLGISPNTVKTHVARLFEKLEAANRTEAIHKARTLDILP